MESCWTLTLFFPHQHRISMCPLQSEGLAERLDAENSLSTSSEGSGRSSKGTDDINHDNHSTRKRPVSKVDDREGVHDPESFHAVRTI
jgi:hypothetical protein